jgi:hypothetical protein
MKMNTTAVNIINCLFTWSIVALAIGGYLVTLKRTREKWPFWVVLAVGWGVLAIFETLLASGIAIGNLQISAVWLASYLLVMTSLLLLFLKFVQIKVGSKTS